jgi:hypothetical protein
VLENVAVGPTAESLGLTQALATRRLTEALDRRTSVFREIGEQRKAA